MLSAPETTAITVGLTCAVFAVIRGPKANDGGNFLMGFASGESISYLLIMAWGAWFNEGVLQAVLRTNSVMLIGALTYSAFMNVRTLPGAMDLYQHISDHFRKK